ncbi:MAG: hypothetical protein QOJ70_37 [Acidobacteriota bacterium]|jgi:hypothetical protein|nr:hypothetical protein [Acidobacteriota bacterium]MDT7806224.1 hypothetical protein [Acidobacteriota bacterium]
MSSSSTARFRKLRTCPRSETLLTFCLGARSVAPTGRVAEHIESCEFCGAEVQLLSRHAPPAGTLPFAAHSLPAPLRRLAEDLLTEPSYNRARFAESLLEIERLTLTDA